MIDFNTNLADIARYDPVLWKWFPVSCSVLSYPARELPGLDHRVYIPTPAMR